MRKPGLGDVNDLPSHEEATTRKINKNWFLFPNILPPKTSSVFSFFCGVHILKAFIYH